MNLSGMTNKNGEFTSRRDGQTRKPNFFWVTAPVLDPTRSHSAQFCLLHGLNTFEEELKKPFRDFLVAETVAFPVPEAHPVDGAEDREGCEFR